MKKAQKKKLPVGITEEFVSEVEAASIDELKSMIVRFQEGINDAQMFLKENEKVLDLKAAYEEAAAPSRETVKSLRNRTKMVLDTLKKMGA